MFVITLKGLSGYLTWVETVHTIERSDAVLLC